MIYTVTFNPSIDYIVRLDSFEEGGLNRTIHEQIFPGGKGINVSLVLKNLGQASTALGFTAGFTGDKIQAMLREQDIMVDFVEIPQGMSRINVKMKSDKETEINGQGPQIEEQYLQMLYDKLESLKEGDFLVLAGSIPSGMTDSLYMDILERMKMKKINSIVDASGKLLVNVLQYHPFLIKPNNHELGEIFHVNISTKEQAVFYAEKLQEMGAGNVLVSMAGEGAVFVGENHSVYMSDAPKGTVINSVGAGDSMVAGFISGYLEKGNYEYAFKKGVCCGSASAFSDKLATSEQVLKLMKETFYMD